MNKRQYLALLFVCALLVSCHARHEELEVLDDTSSGNYNSLGIDELVNTEDDSSENKFEYSTVSTKDTTDDTIAESEDTSFMVTQNNEKKEQTIKRLSPVDLLRQADHQNSASYYYDGVWIYGIGVNDDYMFNFTKTRSDYTDNTKLSTDEPYRIHLIENYLYFDNGVASDPDSAIYKVRTSGTGLTKLYENSGQLTISGNYMYRVQMNQNNTYSVCRTLLNTNQDEILLTSDNVNKYVVVNDMILYSTNDSLHLFNINTNEDNVVVNHFVSNFLFDGYDLYYVKQSCQDDYSNSSLWKCTIEGNDQTLIFDYNIYHDFIIYGDYIYFIYHEDNCRIYRTTITGKDLTLITQDDRVYTIQILDDHLLYSRYMEDWYYTEAIYYADLDGSNRFDLFRSMNDF